MFRSRLRRAFARTARAWAFATSAAIVAAAHAAPPDACGSPDALVERFVAADCESCWRSGSAPGGAAIVLDWIVPDARGDDAALAAAAIAGAAARAGALSPLHTLQRRHVLAPHAAFGVSIDIGPAWNGYIAAQVNVERSAGARAARADGAVAYLALVEQVRAGEEGTPVERMLVRGVAGPLPLAADAAVVSHLHAFRIAQGSRPARLTAIGWVESARGQVLAAARVEPDACLPAR